VLVYVASHGYGKELDLKVLTRPMESATVILN
jgi:hypothetical protein